MSVKAPPLILGEETSSTPPSQYTPPLNSVLKLLRKLNCTDTELMAMPGVSRTLSLIPFWSGMNASFGGVSGVKVEVTHRTPLPGTGFVATQPAGSAGAVTPSKFSVRQEMGVGVGEGVGVGTGVGLGQPSPSV
jgi:hypothetical protein